jgi:hypothetical protein
MTIELPYLYSKNRAKRAQKASPRPGILIKPQTTRKTRTKRRNFTTEGTKKTKGLFAIFIFASLF